MYATIPEFPNMSAQEVFNMSVSHVLNNGKPSRTPEGLCIYGGIGCAASPFLQPAHRDEMDFSGTYGWIGLVQNRYAPNHLTDLVQDLQNAHDTAPDSPAEFIVRFKAMARIIAEQYGLTTEALS